MTSPSIEQLQHWMAGKEDEHLSELRQVLPDLTDDQVKKLLAELRRDGRVRCVGRTKAARWFPVSPSSSSVLTATER